MLKKFINKNDISTQIIRKTILGVFLILIVVFSISFLLMQRTAQKSAVIISNALSSVTASEAGILIFKNQFDLLEQYLDGKKQHPLINGIFLFNENGKVFSGKKSPPAADETDSDKTTYIAGVIENFLKIDFSNRMEGITEITQTEKCIPIINPNMSEGVERRAQSWLYLSFNRHIWNNTLEKMTILLTFSVIGIITAVLGMLLFFFRNDLLKPVAKVLTEMNDQSFKVITISGKITTAFQRLYDDIKKQAAHAAGLQAELEKETGKNKTALKKQAAQFQENAGKLDTAAGKINEELSTLVSNARALKDPVVDFCTLVRGKLSHYQSINNLELQFSREEIESWK